MPIIVKLCFLSCYFALMSEVIKQSTESEEAPSRVEHLLAKLKAFLIMVLPRFIVEWAIRFDKRVDGAVSFFFRHYGKTKFMMAMSKKLQYLGLEKLWKKSPKAFIYFFLFYLVRDTILYIIIPITIARMTSGQ